MEASPAALQVEASPSTHHHVEASLAQYETRARARHNGRALVSTCARLAYTWWWVEGLASTCRVAGLAFTYPLLISGCPSLPQAVPHRLRGG